MADDFPLRPHLDVCRVLPTQIKGKGLGLTCAEDIAKGEELLRIALSKCWTVEAARACPELAALGGELLDAVSEETLIALHILVVRAQGSAAADELRREHIRLLEACEFETLLDWSDEDLQMLAGSKWSMVVPQQRADIEAEFAELAEVIDEFFATHNVTLDNFMWAQRILASRLLKFFMEDGSVLSAIIPGQDLFNHSLDAPVGDEDVNLVKCEDGSRAVAIRAYKDLKADEEATISYSSCSNGRLLMMAGFTIAGNPHDAVELQFVLPCTDAARPVFEALAASLEAGIRGAAGSVAPETKSAFVDALPDGRIALHVQLLALDVGLQLERVLAFFRLVHLCRGGAVPSLQEIADSDADASLRLTVLQQLQEQLRQMLAMYPSSLEQDEAALRRLEGQASEEASLKERRWESSLRVLVGEKRIFGAALAYLDASITASTAVA